MTMNIIQTQDALQHVQFDKEDITSMDIGRLHLMLDHVNCVTCVSPTDEVRGDHDAK
jgi:hypothetical protein